LLHVDGLGIHESTEVNDKDKPSSFLSRRRATALFLQWSTHLHKHSLCGDNNRALFGSCLASTGKHLDLQLEFTEPINPGLAFSVSVLKADFYNQTVISDSRTFLKILTMPNPSHADSGDTGPSLAAVVSGEAVLQLIGGRSKVSVALQPYIASIQVDSGLTLGAVEVLLYAEGLDDLSSIILRCLFPRPSLHYLTWSTHRNVQIRIVLIFFNHNNSASGFKFSNFASISRKCMLL
jgi:hypothetical protein